MPYQAAVTFQAFGRNEYLRSTVGLIFESFNCARLSVPADADGNRVLQSGTVMARITSGGDIGKVGPFWPDPDGAGVIVGAADGRQTAANIVGVCDSFLPYQLNDGDREIAVLKNGRVVASALYEYVSTQVSPGTRGLAASSLLALTTRGQDLDITAL